MEIMEEVLKKIPWVKATAPMIPIFFIDLILVIFMIKLHALNLEYGLIDKFPTDAAFYMFLGVNLFSVFVYLMLSALGLISQNKIDKIRAASILGTAKEA